MKNFFVYLTIIFITIILQTSFIPSFFSENLFPDIVLMLVLAWSIIDGFDDFISWIIIAGLIYDFLSFSVPGVHVIIFAAVAYMNSFFSRRFTFGFNLVGISLVAFFVFSATLISYGVDLLPILVEYNFRINLSNILNLVYTVSLNAAFFVLLYYSIKKIKIFFYIKNERK